MWPFFLRGLAFILFSLPPFSPSPTPLLLLHCVLKIVMVSTRGRLHASSPGCLLVPCLLSTAASGPNVQASLCPPSVFLPAVISCDSPLDGYEWPPKPAPRPMREPSCPCLSSHHVSFQHPPSSSVSPLPRSILRATTPTHLCPASVSSRGASPASPSRRLLLPSPPPPPLSCLFHLGSPSRDPPSDATTVLPHASRRNPPPLSAATTLSRHHSRTRRRHRRVLLLSPAWLPRRIPVKHTGDGHHQERRPESSFERLEGSKRKQRHTRRTWPRSRLPRSCLSLYCPSLSLSLSHTSPCTLHTDTLLLSPNDSLTPLPPPPKLFLARPPAQSSLSHPRRPQSPTPRRLRRARGALPLPTGARRA